MVPWRRAAACAALLADAEPRPPRALLSRPRQPAGARYYPFRQLLDCEGSNFSTPWRSFREKVAANAREGFPVDAELLTWAKQIHSMWEDVAPLRSMTQVKVLTRQSSVEDLGDFCLFAYASSLFLIFRHELEPKHLQDLKDIMGWTEWPLDFSESSGWPAYWRMAPVHMEKMFQRGDLSFSLEDPWGREEQHLPTPSVEEAEAALMQWMGTSRSLSRPQPFSAQQLAHHVSQRLLRLLVAGHHMGSSIEPYTMLKTALENANLDLEVQFHGQRHPTVTMACTVFGFCHENKELSDWMRKWEWKHSWEDDYEWMRDQWPEALEGLAAVLKSDSFFSRVQLVVCGGPAWFCTMLRAVKAVPMLLYFAWPMVPHIPPSLRPQFLLQIQTLAQATSPPAVMVVANWILAAQFALQVRLPTPVQRVHGLYTQQQHSPVPAPNGNHRIMFSRLGVWTGGSGPALLELLWSFFYEENEKRHFPYEPVFLSVRVRAVATIFDVTYEEMSQFYACVYWPWDVMMMLFNELYTMLVPLFVPDKQWVVTSMLWALKHSTQNWWHIRAKNVRSSLPSADGPDDADFPVPEPWIDDAEHRGMEQAAYWYSLTDFEQFPHLTRFRSFAELMQQLPALRTEEVTEGMRKFNEETLASSLDFYRWAAAALLKT